ISSAHAQLSDNSAGKKHFIIWMSMHNQHAFAGTCLAQRAREILLIHCDLPRWCCCLKVALYLIKSGQRAARIISAMGADPSLINQWEIKRLLTIDLPNHLKSLLSAYFTRENPLRTLVIVACAC